MFRRRPAHRPATDRPFPTVTPPALHPDKDPVAFQPRHAGTPDMLTGKPDENRPGVDTALVLHAEHAFTFRLCRREVAPPWLTCVWQPGSARPASFMAGQQGHADAAGARGPEKVAALSTPNSTRGAGFRARPRGLRRGRPPGVHHGVHVQGPGRTCRQPAVV
jgi:hypothetical protein